MNDHSREVTAADIAEILQGLDKAAWRLGYSRDDVLDVNHISAATGIAHPRVGELLDGAEPQQPPRENKARETFYRQMVSQRLDQLRQEGESYRRLGNEIDLSHSLVANLVKGARSVLVEYSNPLEEHYGVAHGFLSRLEGQALAEHLIKVKDGLLAGALLEGFHELGGGKAAALRYTGTESLSMEDLVTALDDLMARKRVQDRRSAPTTGSEERD